MNRILKTPGSEGGARLLAADFDGLIRDGAELRLRGSARVLQDGDMLIFKGPDGGLSSGINVEVDGEGLHSFLQLRPWAHLRIGLERVDEGVYVFRPAPQHMEMLPELREGGAGATQW